MAWARNGTPDTVTTATQPLEISDLTAKKFNQFMVHTINSGTTSGLRTTLNNNTNSVYAFRRSNDGGTDSTVTSGSGGWYVSGGGVSGDEMFVIEYICSISGEEKLGITFCVERNTVGAGTAPNREELVGKFVPSPDADITQINYQDAGAGNYATDSNLSALGTD